MKPVYDEDDPDLVSEAEKDANKVLRPVFWLWLSVLFLLASGALNWIKRLLSGN